MKTKAPVAHVTRVLQSAVMWSWIFNFFRFGSVLLLVPLLFKAVSQEELGVYYMFVAVGQLVVVLDFGFSSTIGRFVSYAMSGAKELVADGVSFSEAGQPNHGLLWELLHTTRVLYRLLTLGSIAVIALFATPFIAAAVGETRHPGVTWLAWVLTILATASELYSVSWNTFLAGMNRVTASNRILAASYLTKLLLSCVLLIAGGGLLSVPIGSLIGSILQRNLSRRACLASLEMAEPEGARKAWRKHLRVMWPNTWKVGLQAGSRFLATYLGILICGAFLETKSAAQLGVSMQLIGMVQSMAMVWTSVKWPLIGQLRVQNDIPGLQALFWPRAWLQTLSFLFGAVVVVGFGPMALDWLGTDKEMLPRFWLTLIAVNAFFETQFTMWGTLISTSNRLPYLWPSVIANVSSLLLALILLKFTSIREGAFILAPLVTGLVFNYWHWPIEGAKSIRTSLIHFLFSRPPRP